MVEVIMVIVAIVVEVVVLVEGEEADMVVDVGATGRVIFLPFN